MKELSIKTNALKYLYVHGGPGLNSTPEKEIIGKLFQEKSVDITFWNEPNPAKDYEQIITDLAGAYRDLGDKVVLIGHSFGARYIIDALKISSKNIVKTFFLSPATEMIRGDKTIIDISLQILEKNNPEVCAQLKSLKPLLEDSEFDQNKANALLLSFQSAYFVSNFVDYKNFEKYFSFLVGENEFRVPDHVRLRQTSQYLTPGKGEFFNIPNQTLIGEKDPIFSNEDEKEMIKSYFPNASIIIIKDSSHYIHIETPEIFFKYLLKD